jgi:hypothetical protein
MMTTFTSVMAISAAQPPSLPTPMPPAPGPSCAVWDAGCQAGQIAQTGFQSLVGEIARGTGEFVVSATTWWITTPSVDPLAPAVGHAQSVLQPLSLAILVGSILAQAIRMMISRKGDPLVQVLLGLVRYAVTAGLGLIVLHAALGAGDALATGILNEAPAKFARLLQAMLLANPTNLWGVPLGVPSVPRRHHPGSPMLLRPARAHQVGDQTTDPPGSCPAHPVRRRAGTGRRNRGSR